MRISALVVLNPVSNFLGLTIYTGDTRSTVWDLQPFQLELEAQYYTLKGVSYQNT